MHFFFYGRDRPGAGSTRQALLQEHWKFMDAYAAVMVARGPTVSADGKSMTGSMHIADLPDLAAASIFANQDPFARGGVFEEITIRQFHNVLGRTMWEFVGDPANPRFLYLAEARPGADASRPMDDQRAYFERQHDGASIILFGPLLGHDGESWAGTAALLEAHTAASAESLVARDPATLAGLYAKTGLHPWRFGGAKNLKSFLGS